MLLINGPLVSPSIEARVLNFCTTEVGDPEQSTMGIAAAWAHDERQELMYSAGAAQVYMELVSPLVESVITGHNATVFAYGQTVRFDGGGVKYAADKSKRGTNEFPWAGSIANRTRA